jgi:large-conductance mechanosensitive channel
MEHLPFGLVRFISFLKEQEILTYTISIIVYYKLWDVVDIILNSCVTPVINYMFGSSLGKLEDLTYQLDDKNKLEFGKVISAICKFIAITYILFVISHVVKNNL